MRNALTAKLLDVRILLPLLLCLLWASPVRAQNGLSLDSALLKRIYNYPRNYAQTISSFQSNVYVKHIYQTKRRNFTLWVIPSMYTIADGLRSFFSEQYIRMTFLQNGEMDTKRQVFYTTIDHSRHPLPTLLEFITPSLYEETLYDDHILSPFYASNQVFYRYNTMQISKSKTRLYFRPRYVKNTQLVHGTATIDTQTGRIIDAEMGGEYDMISFQTITTQGDYGSRALLPKFCRTNVDFNFMGNHVYSAFEAVFDCPITLPDSVNVKGNRKLIDSIRPYGLSEEEQSIYNYHDSIRNAPRSPETLRHDTFATDTTRCDTIETDTLYAAALAVDEDIDTIPQKPRKRKHNYVRWDQVGESLVRRIRFSSEAGYVRLSPIINPEYISYSRRKGFSYRFKLGAQLNLGHDMTLGMNTRFGYNFKQKKFYFTLPIRLDYSYRDRDAYAEIVWANGNRIYNSTVIDEIRHQKGDLPDLDDMGLDQFDDLNLRITNHLPLNNRLSIEAGLVFHRRTAVNKHQMEAMGMPSEYRSLAPNIAIKTHPWRKGPLFTFDWERGLRGRDDHLPYERWEIDASLKHRMHRLQTLNLRLGTGFYTNREKNFFMDYSNFRDENLPEGWDDDWAGNFQLLRSHMYNQSDYYIRGNVSFESPLMAASFIPLLGRYVERERIYLSSLAIAHSRLYSELGYGFTCRYFSIGCFASFLNASYQEFGAKFTFELFRRW